MKLDSKSSVFIGVAAAISCEIIYGLSYFFTKQAIEIAAPLELLGWRFFVAAVAINICVALGLVKINLKGKDLKQLLRIGFYVPIAYFIGETVGIGHTTASESGVFLACIPVASLTASTLILGKKPTSWQVTGIVITLVGVLVNVLAVGATSSFSPVGYICLIAAIISYAIYSVNVEKAVEFTEMEITYAMLVVGAIVFVPLSIVYALLQGDISETITIPFRNMGFLTAILYQGICCSVVAIFLGNVAIAKIGVNRTSSFIGISTVIAIVAGAFLLSEPFTIYQMVGAVIILSGVYIANARSKK